MSKKLAKHHPIGIKMKGYEAQVSSLVDTSSKLDPTQPFMARLDGHRFSKFTKGFKKPFDERIFTAMLHTTVDLVKEFTPTTGYTQSDEITLIWAAVINENDTEDNNKNECRCVMFNGKVQKLATLLAGYCSVRFAYHLQRQTFDKDKEQKLLDKIFSAYFDARVFNIPNNTEVAENIIWRISDIKRNSKNNLGFCHFPHKALHGLKPNEVLEKLREEKGIEWNDQPDPYKFGIFVKKGSFEKECTDLKTGETVLAKRKRVLFGSINIKNISTEVIDFLMCKLIDDCDPSLRDYFECID